MTWNPRLDSFRALCIAGVMLCHWRILDCGWIGVQCFFVLSGYLISGILLDYKQKFSASRYFRVFYSRRALRIFPLYFAWVLLLALGWTWWKVPASFPQVQFYLYTYTINFARVLPGYPDYIHNELYSHLWSLAIEEQFYLLWPVLVLLLPLAKLRILIRICLLIIPVFRLAAGLAFAQLYQAPHLVGEGVYNLPVSHLDAFACGAAIAIGLPELTSQATRKLRGWVCLAGLLGILMLCQPQLHLVSDWTSLGYPSALPVAYQYVWGYSVINIAAALLLSVLRQSSALDHLFLRSSLQFIGRISYGVYVFHWPVQTLFREWFPYRNYSATSLTGFVLSSLTTIAIAWLSFTCFESWFLKQKGTIPLTSQQPLLHPDESRNLTVAPAGICHSSATPLLDDARMPARTALPDDRAV